MAKFTIEVEDFYLEDEELSEGLRAYIKHDVVSQISKNVKEQTQKQITDKIQEVISQKIDLVIDSTLTDLIATGIIEKHGSDISIIDHIKDVFLNNAGWSNPKKQIAEIALEFTKELKRQYDVVFANEIVVKLKEQGFLKDDLVQILLKE